MAQDETQTTNKNRCQDPTLSTSTSIIQSSTTTVTTTPTSSVQSSITTESEVFTTDNLTNVTLTENYATLNVTMATNSSTDDNENITYSQTNSTTYTPNIFTNYTFLENVTAYPSTSEEGFNKTAAQSSLNVSTTTRDPFNYSTSFYTTVTVENEIMDDTDTTQSIVTDPVTDDTNRTEHRTISNSNRKTTDYSTTNTRYNITVASTHHTHAPKGSPDADSTTNNSVGSDIGKFHR